MSQTHVAFPLLRRQGVSAAIPEPPLNGHPGPIAGRRLGASPTGPGPRRRDASETRSWTGRPSPPPVAHVDDPVAEPPLVEQLQVQPDAPGQARLAAADDDREQEQVDLVHQPGPER